MSKFKAFCVKAWCVIVKLPIRPFVNANGAISRKLLYVIVGGALTVIKSKWPEAPLPSVDFIVEALIALIAAHTLTDAIATGATIVGEYRNNIKK